MTYISVTSLIPTDILQKNQITTHSHFIEQSNKIWTY